MMIQRTRVCRVKHFSDKACLVCGKTYTPTAAVQKYCLDCGPIVSHEQIMAAQKRYRALHFEDINEYRATHKEQSCEWRAGNLDKRRLSEAKRRALQYGNTPIAELLTEAQWRDILDQYHHRCAYCGKKMDKLTIDHVVPISKGGKHSVNNVVPACQRCNSIKSAKTPEQWVGMKVTNG